ncbi:MAG: hypothetical protein A2X36_06735 [Elusimicrobia bacterium GWA2_69_24]|nr:MAG: hypothetical protein A2X36_06735 [Elusimicrobia bacterium GWA2_69_24]
MWGLTWDERLLDLLLPRTCAGCREDLPPPMQGPLCGPCLGLLARRRLPPPRRRNGRLLGPVSAAFAYAPPLPALVHAFKYGRRLAVGDALGAWMAGAWGLGEGGAAPDALVPVPLHPRRERDRGFNQARILARWVSGRTGVPVWDALRRQTHTPPQARVRRSRRARAMTNAFRADPDLDLWARRIVLIDDVCTTGGTLEGCALALFEAGAAAVDAFVLAQA